MSNFPNQPDPHAGNMGSEQFGEATSGGDTDAIYVEEKKPINRNLILLLLLVLLGAAMVYFMYMRGSAKTGNTTTNPEAEDILANGGKSLLGLEIEMGKTARVVEAFRTPNFRGQVDPSDLKTNPFSFETEEKKTDDKKPLIDIRPVNSAMGEAREALKKLNIQSIIYSETAGSTCVVNNKVYRQGQDLEVDGVHFQVQQIGTDFVILKHPQSTFKLEIKNKNDISR